MKLITLVPRLGNPAGTVCYPCKGYDYGCSSDDTDITGVEHISVTLKPDGDYPFFTIATTDVKEAK